MIKKINKRLFAYPSENILINSEAIRHIRNYTHFVFCEKTLHIPHYFIMTPIGIIRTKTNVKYL